MKTVFEPINENSSFSVEKDKENDVLYFRSITDYSNSPFYISFALEKEEALNLAQHILKLYSNNG